MHITSHHTTSCPSLTHLKPSVPIWTFAFFSLFQLSYLSWCHRIIITTNDSAPPLLDFPLPTTFTPPCCAQPPPPPPSDTSNQTKHTNKTLSRGYLYLVWWQWETNFFFWSHFSHPHDYSLFFFNSPRRGELHISSQCNNPHYNNNTIVPRHTIPSHLMALNFANFRVFNFLSSFATQCKI